MTRRTGFLLALSGAHRLAPGESISFDKLWGFTVDTGHEHVR